MMPVNSEAPLESTPALHTALGPPNQPLVCAAEDGTQYYRDRDFLIGDIYGNRRTLIPNIIVYSCAIGDDGSFYLVGTSAGENWLRAYSRVGELKWSVPTNKFCSSPALGPDGAIYLFCMPQTGNTELTAYDANGTVLWSLPTGGFDWKPLAPAIAPDGTIYIYSGVRTAAEIIAVSSQGEKLWSASVGARVNKIVLAPAGQIVADVPNGNIIALDPKGHKIWSFYSDRGSQSEGLAIAGDGTVYFVSGFLYAIDRTGRMKWVFKSELTFTQGDHFEGDPVIAEDGTVYVDSSLHQLYAITAAGRKKWVRSGNVPRADGPILLTRKGILRTGYGWFAVSSGLADRGWPAPNHDTRNTRSEQPQ